MRHIDRATPAMSTGSSKAALLRTLANSQPPIPRRQIMQCRSLLGTSGWTVWCRTCGQRTYQHSLVAPHASLSWDKTIPAREGAPLYVRLTEGYNDLRDTYQGLTHGFSAAPRSRRMTISTPAESVRGRTGLLNGLSTDTRAIGP